MDINDNNIKVMSEFLANTLSPDPDVRRPGKKRNPRISVNLEIEAFFMRLSAEQFLEKVDHNRNFPQILLHLIEKEDIDTTIRISAAIAFKNYISRNWFFDSEKQDVDRIHESDREAIKRMIVPMMLKSPVSIQSQFSKAIEIIGKYDFPKKWPLLMDEMTEKFGTGDFHVINGILKTADSIFHRYRSESKSQQLWEEIKMVLDKFAKPLTDLLQVMIFFSFIENVLLI